MNAMIFRAADREKGQFVNGRQGNAEVIPLRSSAKPKRSEVLPKKNAERSPGRTVHMEAKGNAVPGLPPSCSASETTLRFGQVSWKLFSILGLFLALGSPSWAKDVVRWETNIDAAFAKAKANNLPVFLHFYGEHCPPCRMMEKQVFSRDDVADAIHRNFVPVKIDTANSPSLVQQYAITGIPADIVMTPGGRVLFRQVGGQKAESFRSRLTQVAGYYKNRLSVVEQASSGPPAVVARPEEAYAENAYGRAANRQSFPSHLKPSRTSVAPEISTENRSSHPSSKDSHVSSSLSSSQRQAVQSRRPMTNGMPAGSSQHSLLSSDTQQPTMAPMGYDQRNMAELRHNSPSRQELDQIEAELQKLRAEKASRTASAGNASRSMADERPKVGGSSHGVSEGRTGSSATAAQDYEDDVFAPSVAGRGATLQQQAGRLALDGYCPILLTDEERWVPGSSRWSLVHQGLRYCFSSPEARRKFIDYPSRYAPVLAGQDVVLMVQEGKRVPGKREFGVWYEGLIFLFSTQESFDRFHENPQYFAKIASRLHGSLSQQRPPQRR
jgi:YHS domain-containing protein/thiol-disulfide isomerase/thioredoxin